MRKYIVLLSVFSCSILFAVNPIYDAPVPIQSGGAAINVGYTGSPFVFDWNGDGKKDLLIGQFTEGRVRFYPNTGTDNNPAFNGFSYLQADGTDIILTYG